MDCGPVFKITSYKFGDKKHGEDAQIPHTKKATDKHKKTSQFYILFNTDQYVQSNNIFFLHQTNRKKGPDIKKVSFSVSIKL